MLNALKKMDKKFLILVCIIFGLPVFIIVFIAIIQGCSSSKISYEEYEQKMKTVAEGYLTEAELKKMSEGETIKIELEDLVESNKIKSPKQLLNDSSCDGNVVVRKNGSTIKQNQGGFYNYIVSLECDNYKTKTIKDALMKNVVSSDAGLYSIGENYIFKGKDVDNYISFYGTEYRIMSIDKNGILKLIKSESETINKYWDIKYNTETSNNSGKNIYRDSDILQEIIKIYLDVKNFKKSAKTRIIAQDLCVDPRDVNDLSKDTKKECNGLVENQVISLIGVEDFSNASLDPECYDIKSKSCRNYNYLNKLHLNTWTYTAVLNNTYEVYYLSNGVINVEEASKCLPLNIVIYIDGNENYKSGDGSQTNPFVIE
jgi:hypothetical protein